MKRTNILLYLGLAGGMIGCAECDLSPDSGEPERVPITLQAGNRTKAVVNPGSVFEPLLLCSNTEKDYQKLRWQNNASVDKDGIVSYDGYAAGEGPTYPYEDNFPFDVYVSGVHPQTADLTTAPNFAIYVIDGEQDIMYAPEVFGNYADGHKLSGNTDPAKDKPLVFTHLLTQLQFKACRTGDAGAKEFKITRITLQAVPVSVTISLVDGNMEVAGTTKPLNAPVNSVAITSTDEEEPTTVGYALVPAAAGYVAEVETTLGTFPDVQIRPTSGSPLEAGMAHAITLKLNDKGLIVSRVTAASWTDVEGGEIEL